MSEQTALNTAAMLLSPAAALAALGISIFYPRKVPRRVEISTATGEDRKTLEGLRVVYASRVQYNLGHYTSASGAKKTSRESALDTLIKTYPPLGILDRTFLRKGGKKKTDFGNWNWEWQADTIRCVYLDKRHYWDLLETITSDRLEDYVSALTMWPVANIDLSPYYPLGGKDYAVSTYGGYPPEDGQAFFFNPGYSGTDRERYAGYVGYYFDLVTKYVGDKALLAAMASAQSDENYVHSYAKAVFSEINALKTLSSMVNDITVKGPLGDLYTTPFGLPKRLGTIEEAQAAITRKPNPMDREYVKEVIGAMDLRPIAPGDVWNGLHGINTKSRFDISDWGCVTIPVKVNGVMMNLTARAAINYFNNVALYLLLRNHEKLWSRYAQLSGGVPLVKEDVLYDPHMNIFLNQESDELLKETGKRLYVDEAQSTAPRDQLMKTIELRYGPSAFDMLKGRQLSAKYAKTRTLNFTADLTDNRPGGTEKDGGIGGLLLAAGIGVLGYAYAKKEGYL